MDLFVVSGKKFQSIFPFQKLKITFHLKSPKESPLLKKKDKNWLRLQLLFESWTFQREWRKLGKLRHVLKTKSKHQICISGKIGSGRSWLHRQSIKFKLDIMQVNWKRFDRTICEHEECLVVVINREREEKTRQAHWFTTLWRENKFLQKKNNYVFDNRLIGKIM